MKRTILVVIGILVLLMASCAITPKLVGIFNEDIPESESAWITPAGTGKVISYNGIPVDWNWKGLSFTMYQIPAGNTILEWDIDSRDIIGKGIIFQYNFLPGKQYHFYPSWKDGNYGFWVFEDDFRTKIPPNVMFTSGAVDTKKSIGFFPFLNTNNRRRTASE